MPNTTRPSAALGRWRIATGAALLIGYSGYYLCRSNLAVAAPLLATEPGLDLDRTTVGIVASTGVAAYAAGKSITGVAGDFLGGRTLFLSGLFLSVACTWCFGASTSLLLLTFFWTLNRLVQSAGWSGLTKTAVHWFPPERYGAVMSILSLSFLFGDAAGRYVLGSLLSTGLSWRELFAASGALLAAIGAAVALVLRDSPTRVGLPEPRVSSSNVFGARGAASCPDNLYDLLQPYFSSSAFWLICTLSFGMTTIREALNLWIPAYLVDVHGLAVADAARYSAIFPLIGGLSALAVGVLADRTAGGNRVALIVPAMLGCAVSLALLVAATSTRDLRLSVLALAAVATCLLGPYSLLAGAIAMDLGGRRGSATAAGLIDSAGYIGGAAIGVVAGWLAGSHGWSTVFLVLAGLSVLVTVAAVRYGIDHKRRLTWTTAEGTAWATRS